MTFYHHRNKKQPEKKRGGQKGIKRPEHSELMMGNNYALGNPGGGRISGYKNEFARQASHLCKLGASTVDLARFFQVSSDTIYRWSTEYKAFAEAIKVGKDLADERVVMSLYNKTLGFEKEIVKEVVGKDGNVKKVTDKVYYPPSDTAIMFWLKNRRRHEWRDRQEHEIGRPGEFEEMSNEQLAKFIEGEIIDDGSRESRALPPPTEDEG